MAFLRLFLLFAVVLSGTAAADSGKGQQTESILAPLNPLTMISRTFSKFPALTERVDPRTHKQEWLTVAGLSLALYFGDQEIYGGSRYYSRKIGLLNRHGTGRETKCVICSGGDIEIEYPVSLNAGIWYLGDSLTSVLAAAAFAGYGVFAEDSYHVKTASYIFQSLLMTGLIVFPIKMITGRESPSKASESGGKWQGFPGFATYASNQSKYYAYPSGHTASFVATLTVIAERYGDFKWIRPLGYVGAGLLMVSLMNNQAHWASDYPLAVAIGHSAAMAIIAEPNGIEQAKLRTWKISPVIVKNFLGLQGIIEF